MKVKDHTKDEGFEAFKGLGKSSPMLAFAMVIGIISLAGIPPTAGFFGKYFLFADVFKDYGWLVLVAILNSAISIYYYFRIVIAMYFTEKEHGSNECVCLTPMNTGVVAVCVTGIFALGILSGFLQSLLN
jgi:NADH-quinone oxidoreductase subunit N